MGWDTPDVYNQPEQFGLTIVAEFQERDEPYSFDIVVGFKHEDGRFFMAQDSGCSCPIPFERHTSLDALDEVRTIEDVERFIDGLYYGTYRVGDVLRFIRAMEKEMDA